MGLLSLEVGCVNYPTAGPNWTDYAKSGSGDISEACVPCFSCVCVCVMCACFINSIAHCDVNDKRDVSKMKLKVNMKYVQHYSFIISVEAVSRNVVASFTLCQIH